MNFSDFEVKRSRVEVTTTPNVVNKQFGNFEGHAFTRLDYRPFWQKHIGRRFAVM